MISGTVALAFTAGMVATFNPCGFSLLPAYIGAFVVGDEVSDRADRRVLRAIGVAGAVSIGFIIVFTSIGLVIDRIAGEAQRQLPWVTISIGALLLVAGVATASGWKPTLALGRPRFSGSGNNVGVMVGYGVTYAVASLSCTIGPFLAVTGAALAGSPIEAIGAYLAYALGMGVVILVLGVASALAHTTVANHMSRISRVAPRIGGVLMVLAGGYAIWYGRWELAVYDGDLSTDPVIDAIEAIRLWFVTAIEAVGAQRLAVLTAAALIAVTVAARSTGKPNAAHDTESPDIDAAAPSSSIPSFSADPSAPIRRRIGKETI